MPSLALLDLVDLLALLVVVTAVIGTLRRRAGVLAALGSGLGALVLAWLIAVAAATWAPPQVATAARDSRLVTTVPVPERALTQAEQLLDRRPAPGDPR